MFKGLYWVENSLEWSHQKKKSLKVQYVKIGECWDKTPNKKGAACRQSNRLVLITEAAIG